MKHDGLIDFGDFLNSFTCRNSTTFIKQKNAPALALVSEPGRCGTDKFRGVSEGIDRSSGRFSRNGEQRIFKKKIFSCAFDLNLPLPKPAQACPSLPRPHKLPNKPARCANGPPLSPNVSGAARGLVLLRPAARWAGPGGPALRWPAAGPGQGAGWRRRRPGAFVPAAPGVLPRRPRPGPAGWA